ncbi:MAG: type II/IV secretion system protein [Verrucomicrobia bacterium]|mgnify:FL=1|jgi:type II secretory ATPase GspE/PulE/Tfp pilus assembly ATPase PilB-like protein|nr:type II/IV secretion system protein [Verrucomicrobiota bacterium]MBT7909997.1 type II/IV secretion system protein [Verrucomicrobiota bacterium]
MDLTSSYIRAVKSLDQIDIAVLVNNIILDAVHDKASDIHIEPWESTLPIRLRISGTLRELTHLPYEFLDRIAGRFKVMADLVTYETELPQEGRVPASAEFGNVELRVSIFPTVRGEKIVIRLFDPQNRSFNLETLGFESDTIERFKKLIRQPSGLILLNGPTGSGKTTAIYSALCHLIDIHGPTISISTVEDPVEFNLPMISQSQISNSRGFTYPKALRSLMRQDPEAIMIGEIRDAETAAIAVQAGLTGHMIFSTIHSDSTAGVYARLINMDIEPFLLASSVTGVLGLRLLRTICPGCKIQTQPNPEYLSLLPDGFAEENEFYTGTGCDSCSQTGYLGRVAATELLNSSEAVREGVIQKLRTSKLHDIAIEQGMTTLWQNAMAKVQRGITSLEEVIRVISINQL